MTKKLMANGHFSPRTGTVFQRKHCAQRVFLSQGYMLTFSHYIWYIWSKSVSILWPSFLILSTFSTNYIFILSTNVISPSLLLTLAFKYLWCPAWPLTIFQFRTPCGEGRVYYCLSIDSRLWYLAERDSLLSS